MATACRRQTRPSGPTRLPHALQQTLSAPRPRHDLPLPGRRDELPRDDLRQRPVVHDRRAGSLRTPVTLSRARPSLPATRPVLGKSATIAATAGAILVQLPGTGIYLPLSAASTVPVGTTIDATRGTLKLTNIQNSSGKLQTGSFWGGAFTFRQTRGKLATTVLTLTAPMSCPKSRLHLASATAGKRARASSGGRTTTVASSPAAARRSRPCAAPPGSRATPVRARSSA